MNHEMLEMNDTSFKALHPKLKLPLLNYRLDTRYALCLRLEKTRYQLKLRAAEFDPLEVPIPLRSPIDIDGS